MHIKHLLKPRRIIELFCRPGSDLLNSICYGSRAAMGDFLQIPWKTQVSIVCWCISNAYPTFHLSFSSLLPIQASALSLLIHVLCLSVCGPSLRPQPRWHAMKARAVSRLSQKDGNQGGKRGRADPKGERGKRRSSSNFFFPFLGGGGSPPTREQSWWKRIENAYIHWKRFECKCQRLYPC